MSRVFIDKRKRGNGEEGLKLGGTLGPLHFLRSRVHNCFTNPALMVSLLFMNFTAPTGNLATSFSLVSKNERERQRDREKDRKEQARISS